MAVTNAPITNRPIPPMRIRLLMTAFFGVFFAAGAAFLYFGFARAIGHVVSARAWTATSCDVVFSRVVSSASDNGQVHRVEVRYRYVVDGVPYVGDRYKFMSGSSSGYSGKAAIVDRLRPGTTTPCWVDPADPREAVIERGLTADMLFALLPLLFVLIGGGGMYAMLVRGPSRVLNSVPALGGRRSGSVVSYETAPRRGPTILKPRSTRRTQFIAVLLFALAWNGFIGAFMTSLLTKWRSGVIEWGMALFMTPFVIVGLVMIVIAVVIGMQLVNPRPVLTVSSDAVSLGDELRVQWGIDGRVEKLLGFRILLEGREEATYRRGTDTRTDRHVFLKLPIVEEISPVPAEGSKRVTIPADSMHSFESANNKIVWSLRVYGEIPNWPDSDDEFAFTVLPQPR